jgi:hypothetical protein
MSFLSVDDAVMSTIKQIKQIKPIKQIKQIKPIKPIKQTISLDVNPLKGVGCMFALNSLPQPF